MTHLIIASFIFSSAFTTFNLASARDFSWLLSSAPINCFVCLLTELSCCLHAQGCSLILFTGYRIYRYTLLCQWPPQMLSGLPVHGARHCFSACRPYLGNQLDPAHLHTALVYFGPLTDSTLHSDKSGVCVLNICIVHAHCVLRYVYIVHCNTCTQMRPAVHSTYNSHKVLHIAVLSSAHHIRHLHSLERHLGCDFDQFMVGD